MAREIRIPDIGDIESVEVIEICVAAGDAVEAEDPLIVIESDKASMEVPAGVAGTVDEITVSVGDSVAEGDLIAKITAGEDAGADGSDDADADADSGDDADDRVTAAERADDGDADGREASAGDGPSDADADDDRPEAPAAEDGGGSGDEGGTVEVRVPDIGDAKDVVVIEVAVSAGDEVGAEDLLIVVESDKASMEIPAGQAGTVAEVHVSEGTEVNEGTLLVTLKTTGGTGDDADQRRAEGQAPQRGKKPEAAPARSEAGESRREAPQASPRKGTPDDIAAKIDEAESGGVSGGNRVYAGPAVRRLARELGVDLTQVQGTGSRGRITKDDVKSFVKTLMKEGGQAAGAGIPAIPEVDFSKFGPIDTQALSRVRAAGAANLHRAWLNIPHVTQHEEVDITELEEFRATLKSEGERRGVKVTPLAFIIKACCHTLKAFPTFNASLDAGAKNFILKRYYHIGMAVDTEQGLVVPVIKDADKKGIWELSDEIAELAGKARDGKLGMGDMQGGSFSVSSLGAIGGTGFTPIINAPEVAILGVAKLATRPMWDGDQFRPRKMLPVSLSYDHRAINGAEAGRFVTHLAGLLSDIRRLAL